MNVRAFPMRWPALVAIVVATVLLTPASAGAKKPPVGGGGFSTTSTYVKNYADVLNGAEYSLTPEDVHATPDGGWTALALTSNGPSWLVKASAVGAPQGQGGGGGPDGAPGRSRRQGCLQ